MRVEDITKTLDHTVLAPETTAGDVERSCELARQHHIAALCSHPRFVALMAGRLRGCDVKVCAAIDFPGGDSGAEAKLAAALAAVDDGADELDVVMNYKAMLAGDFRTARDELVALVRAVRARAANSGRGDVLVKVDIEAPLLEDKLTRLACMIVESAGGDFAKTCTGVDTVARVRDVELMRDALSERVGVKAAGGVRTLEDVHALVGAGAARVGSSVALELLSELAARNGDR